MPDVCIERCKLLTRSYQETEGEPMVIRRAKALSKILEEITLQIEDWQLIVGNFAGQTFATSVFPEYSWQWVLDELDTLPNRPVDKFRVTEEAKDVLCELLPWWKNRSVQEHVTKILPEDVQKALEKGLISSGVMTSGIGQCLPNYEKVLQLGFSGLEQQVLTKLEEMDLTIPEQYSKKINYEAWLIVCRAVRNFMRRYAEFAHKNAEMENRDWRRKELMEISDACKNISEGAPRTFHEALQLFWFSHVIAYLEQDGLGIAGGRFDQYMYPFYKKDIESGRITREKAKRLLESLWINFNQILTFFPLRTAGIWSGYPISQQPMISGPDAQGRDATNEISELILEVEESVRLPQPDIGVICHKQIPDDFLVRASKVVKQSMKPKFYNYEVAVQQNMMKGISEEDAREHFAAVGCVSPTVEGRYWGPQNVGFVNLAKCLELTLNDGVDPVSGERIGPQTGDRFASFDDLMSAFYVQVNSAIQKLIIVGHAVEKTHRELVPLPYGSLLIDDCIENGLDLTQGGARYNIPAVEAVGLGSLVDSLIVIKKAAFEEKSINLVDLIENLKHDFPDEVFRNQLIRNYPKYGDDVDEVDQLAREIGLRFCEEAKKYKCFRGTNYSAGLYSVSAHVGMGGFVGATPDGRRKGEPLSDGVSPAQGRCQNGPTAVINSVAKLAHAAAGNGTLLNMKFTASLLNSNEKLENFAALIKAYMELGGYHVQFNIIDTETLRDAQKHPENYPDLLVRVAAYVALFCQLPKKLQDDIIARTELGI